MARSLKQIRGLPKGAEKQGASTVTKNGATLQTWKHGDRSFVSISRMVSETTVYEVKGDE